MTKLLKSILIPTLGITSIGTIPVVSTSCGCDEFHVSSVSLDKTSLTLNVGQTKTLSVTILPKYAPNKSVTWKSSDESVATVDANGKITAIGLGNATITVTSVNNPEATATCKVNVIDLSRYIGITANADSTLTLDNSDGNNPNLQYSIDCTKWTTYSTTININQGETLYLKGNNPTGWSHSNSIYSYLSIKGNISVSGNVMALLDNGATLGEIGNITAIPCDYCFYDLFRDSTGITSVSEDFLPATNLKICCYVYMFDGCTSLTAGPVLPAKSLTDGCYRGMFNNCTALTTAPDLPATTLTENCYWAMFAKCTSLTVAPELPATILKSNCYDEMFSGCSSLNSIKIGYTGNYDPAYFDSWISGVANSGTFYYNGNQTAQDFKLSSGWTTIHYQNYVVITANAESTLTLIHSGLGINLDLQYSIDCTKWTTYSTTININQGQTLYLKGNNPTGWSHSSSIYSYLSITGDVSLSGNIMALLDNGAQTGESGDITDIPCEYCFYSLFDGSTGITSVSEDFLPATRLANSCYRQMFQDCSSLITAPELPATTLANYCYRDMFFGCTSLTTAPELPATTLSELCYGEMFSGCSSLTVAPELPATTLTNYCYFDMFFGCTSLTTAPKLPATILADSCYYAMFDECTSLTTAPDLPATNLTNYCYSFMFSDCSSLIKAPNLPATNLKNDCYAGMFFNCSSLNSIKIGYKGDYNSQYFYHWASGVANSGTFYYNGTTQTAQDFKLPSGWTTTPYQKYVAITANADSTLTLKYSGLGINLDLQYSTDGINWTTYGSTININQGQTICLRGNNPTGWSTSNSIYSYFSITGDVSISGNVMALLDNGAISGEQGDITDIPCNYCFYDLFRDSTGITSVSEDFLPATSLTTHCYAYMFYGCSSLTVAPDLPAKALAVYCYDSMFYKCTSLTTAPDLLARWLANSCYCQMFQDCSSLNSIKIGYIGGYSDTYFNNWVSGVASSGTFYYIGNQTAQDFKLPSGWTKHSF